MRSKPVRGGMLAHPLLLLPGGVFAVDSLGSARARAGADPVDRPCTLGICHPRFLCSGAKQTREASFPRVRVCISRSLVFRRAASPEVLGEAGLSPPDADGRSGGPPVSFEERRRRCRPEPVRTTALALFLFQLEAHDTAGNPFVRQRAWAPCLRHPGSRGTSLKSRSSHALPYFPHASSTSFDSAVRFQR